MIAYLDASALVKRYVREARSAEVRALSTEHLVATSRYSEIEIASALLRRGREGSIETYDRDRALAAVARDFEAL